MAQNFSPESPLRASRFHDKPPARESQLFKTPNLILFPCSFKTTKNLIEKGMPFDSLSSEQLLPFFFFPYDFIIIFATTGMPVEWASLCTSTAQCPTRSSWMLESSASGKYTFLKSSTFGKHRTYKKVHKNENFWAPILDFSLCCNFLCSNQCFFRSKVI